MKKVCSLPCPKIFHNAQYDVGWLEASGITVNGPIIDTIHSVKGGEANHVVLYSKGNFPSDYSHKSKQEKSDERRVWYTGATRARKTLHLLRTDYKFNYPIGADYLIYVQEKNDK